jgi:ubiquinone/menaquinone biosynthesis C-methylase UbiE
MGMWLTHIGGAWHMLKLAITMVFIGIPLYFLVEMYYDPKMIVRVNGALASLAKLTENFNLPPGVRRKLVGMLGDVKGKVVLEYGCGVGSLTMLLAEKVGLKGKVYATVTSKHEHHIVEERVKKKGHNHVKIFKVEPDELHRRIPKVDLVVSAGEIGYVSQEERLLKSLSRRMKRGGKIVFLEYDKFFDVIPNIEWLSDDEKIKEIFDKGGFKVNVRRKQGVAWQYIYIFGRKVR